MACLPVSFHPRMCLAQCTAEAPFPLLEGPFLPPPACLPLPFLLLLLPSSFPHPASQVVPDAGSVARWSALTAYLHAAKPPVKVLYSVASSNFAAMSKTAARRATFIASAIAAARK